MRACSAMTNGVADTIKNLFREYERLGVFEWHHLKTHFKNPNADGFALEFTDTELLNKPVSLDKVNEILVGGGARAQTFPSTVKISQSAFEKIYQHAVSQE